MGKITGRVEVLVNGDLLLNKTGAVASGLGLSGQPAFERKEVLGDTGLHGYVEEPVPAMLEVTVTDRDDVNINDFALINGTGTIILRAARGGKIYTMNGATCTNNITLTAGEGETNLVFKGPFWSEDS
jgi:hypothetical protein